jgi:hypothetical protein
MVKRGGGGARAAGLAIAIKNDLLPGDILIVPILNRTSEDDSARTRAIGQYYWKWRKRGIMDEATFGELDAELKRSDSVSHLFLGVRRRSWWKIRAQHRLILYFRNWAAKIGMLHCGR